MIEIPPELERALKRDTTGIYRDFLARPGWVFWTALVSVLSWVLVVAFGGTGALLAGMISFFTFALVFLTVPLSSLLTSLAMMSRRHRIHLGPTRLTQTRWAVLPFAPSTSWTVDRLQGVVVQDHELMIRGDGTEDRVDLGDLSVEEAEAFAALVCDVASAASGAPEDIPEALASLRTPGRVSD